MRRRGSAVQLWLAAAAAGALGAVGVAVAVIFQPTPKLVTNTTSGKNQNPSIDKTGNLIVFTSNVNRVTNVTASPTGTFDFDNTGNDFTPVSATHPNPACANCNGVDSADGQLFLWRQKAHGADPANSVKQITFDTGGGFAANEFPDVNQNGTVVAWDSDRNHTGGNADNSREIFFYDIAAATITQVTNNAAGGGDAANRNVNWSDDGSLLVFDSNRDYAGVLGCTLTDGATACDNSDNNSEVMLYNRTGNTLTQITKTTGGGGFANIRPRISNDGTYIAFQSTVDYSGVLPAGATCTLSDGTSACNNDGNSEIMLYVRPTSPTTPNTFTQITHTANVAPCAGSGSSERVEISKKGKFVTFQSQCEAQLNPTPACGSCNGNDEAFVFDRLKKKLVQITISDTGINRVPRVSGSGRFIIFESNRNYNGLNPGHSRTLYIILRNTAPAPTGVTLKGQVVEDAGSTLTQNARTKLLTINFAGGFNTTIEQFAVSTRGRFYAFDNKKGVKNQEVWFLDRNH